VTELIARYRLRAAYCVELAEKISDPEGRLALLSMAKSWLALAEQAVKKQRNRAGLRNTYAEAKALALLRQ